MMDYTNTKAHILHVGLGDKNPDFVDFTLDELMKHTALYLFQGLSPSSQIEMKFKSSNNEDPINGNDLVHRAFGGESGISVIRRHKHFKVFLHVLIPSLKPQRVSRPHIKKATTFLNYEFNLLPFIYIHIIISTNCFLYL